MHGPWIFGLLLATLAVPVEGADTTPSAIQISEWRNEFLTGDARSCQMAAENLLQNRAMARTVLESFSREKDQGESAWQTNQLMALLGAGEPSDGWQLALGLVHTAIPEGDIVPLRISITNRSPEVREFVVPKVAKQDFRWDKDDLQQGEVQVRLRKIGDPVQVSNDRVESKLVLNEHWTLKPEEVGNCRMVLIPDRHSRGINALSPDPGCPIRAKAALSTGTYEIQVACRARNQGVVLASNVLQFSVTRRIGPDEQEEYRKRLATAEASLGKDAALRSAINSAVEALGSEDWDSREDAARTLTKAGVQAISSLEKVQAQSGNLEAQKRATEILDAICWNAPDSGPPEGGYCATLRQKRKTYFVGDVVKLGLDVRNVSKKPLSFVRIRHLKVSSLFESYSYGSGRAQLEIVEEKESSRPAIDQEEFGDLEPDREPDTVILHPGEITTMDVNVVLHDGAKKLDSDELSSLPNECRVTLPPGRYRIRIVYFALTLGLLPTAEDELKSNWIALEVKAGPPALK